MQCGTVYISAEWSPKLNCGKPVPGPNREDHSLVRTRAQRKLLGPCGGVARNHHHDYHDAGPARQVGGYPGSSPVGRQIPCQMQAPRMPRAIWPHGHIYPRSWPGCSPPGGAGCQASTASRTLCKGRQGTPAPMRTTDWCDSTPCQSTWGPGRTWNCASNRDCISTNCRTSRPSGIHPGNGCGYARCRQHERSQRSRVCGRPERHGGGNHPRRKGSGHCSCGHAWPRDGARRGRARH